MNELDVVNLKILLKMSKNEAKKYHKNQKCPRLQASPQPYHHTKKATGTLTSLQEHRALEQSFGSLLNKMLVLSELNSNMTLELQPLMSLILLA